MNVVKTSRSKEEQLRLLEETVNFYSDDTKRLAMFGNGGSDCLYRTDDGRKCAVGRCMNEIAFDGGINLDSLGSVYSVARELDESDDNLDILLKDKYKGYSIKLWARLQSLHDRSSHWDDKGITKVGEVVVDEIKDAIINNLI